MQHTYKKLLLSLCLLASTHFVYSQISSGGMPLGLQIPFKEKYNTSLQTTSLPAFPLAKVLKEDQSAIGTRFAAPIAVDFDLDNVGEWTNLDNGDRLWRLQIQSTGALGLSALYDALYLPKGSHLFMYTPDGTQTLGAYTHESNTPNGTFMTGFTRGETAIIEYYEPKAVRGQGQLHIFRIDHAYRKSAFEEKSIVAEVGFGASTACNVNVNCPQGSKGQKQKKGVCRIVVVVEQGTGYCTGTLMNNTAKNGKPYILSAFHCQDGFTPKYDFWRYDFNYETTGCVNPSAEPTFQSMLGSTLRAGYRNNDFLLLELKDSLPTLYNAYFNGWNRNAAVPATPFTIHHPKGDIKKIALDNQSPIVYGSPYQWQNGNGIAVFTSPPSHLLRVQFDASTVEVGSSGAALFDVNGRVVGQLHGGTKLGDCMTPSAYYDRLTLSWEGGGTPQTRLKDWLDPNATNVTQLDGMERKGIPTAIFSGRVFNSKGAGIARVRVVLNGSFPDTTITDTAGTYTFSKLLFGEVLGVSLLKENDDRNGISILDIIALQKHILGVQPLATPVQLLAADVNHSKSVSVLDLIEMRKLILGITSAFPNGSAWTFIPKSYEFTDPKNPWEVTFPSVFHRTNFISNILDFDFVGIKIGDIDYSANVKN